MKLPDLKDAKTIAIDLETYDPQLKTGGALPSRTGHILGISLAADTGENLYIPVGHIDNENNQEPWDYLREQLGRVYQVKVGANIIYDLEWLQREGVAVKGPLFDVLIAEALIDENQFVYNLDRLAQKYLNLAKDKSVLEELCKEQGLRGDFRQHLHLFNSSAVREYALADTTLPLLIAKKQRDALKEQGLGKVFDIEMRLVPLLLQMRTNGCRIDINKAHGLRRELLQKKEELEQKIYSSGLDPRSTDAGRQKLAQFFDSKGIEYEMTPRTGKPKFDAEFLQRFDYPEIKTLRNYKKIDKFVGTFLDSQLLGTHKDGRIHAYFNQMKATDGGTVTGRFSSSRPNLQNIPSRGQLGKLCRSLFLPEDGELFGSLDYSQIEYRILCHYARGDSGDAVRKAFVENPNLDIHQWCADIIGITRTQAKTTNFGIIYGQGLAKTAETLELNVDEAKDFLKNFNGKMPFIRQTSDHACGLAIQRGYVHTFLGRRRHFDRWEPANFDDKRPPLDYPAAKAEYDHVKRAFTYRALNAVIQGSAADLLKLAMVTAYEAGVFKVLTPLTTVHDELNVSVPNTEIGIKMFDKLKEIMQTCYTFKVPILVEGALGKNWEEAKK
jgi:DNA polymerase-1